jgi:hypothetical protein
MPILLPKLLQIGSLSYHILNRSNLEEEWPSMINGYEDFLPGASERPWFLTYMYELRCNCLFGLLRTAVDMV